jgi:hypothetical protein
MFTPEEAAEIIGALSPVRDKVAGERGIYGTSKPLPHMARRVKVKGLGIDSVRQHEAMTDRRLATLDGAIAKARTIIDAGGDALVREWAGDPPERTPLPAADQVTLWRFAALLLARLKIYRHPPPLGIDHALTDSIIEQAADTLTEIVPPGVEDFDLRQVKSHRGR